MSVKIGSVSELGVSSSAVAEFYQHNWGRPIALSDDLFYKWQFVDNPTNTSRDDCCIALHGDEIIGVMGLTARDFYLNGTKKKGAELTTWVVSEQYRNKGSGPQMISWLKENYDVMIGMGISAAALPVYLRNGFRYSKSIPRHVHVINWDNVDEYIEMSPIAKKYARSVSLLDNYKIESVDSDKLDVLADKFFKNHNGFSRYQHDINWRYTTHPLFSYHSFICKSDAGQCFIAVRVDKDINGFVMAHCVDIFGDKSAYPQAICAAIRFAESQGADAVDFFATQTGLNACLNAMGLFSTLDHEFFKFPHLFHPVEIRNPATTSLILWSKEDMNDLLDLGRLHITKQDADFDRPTVYGIKK